MGLFGMFCISHLTWTAFGLWRMVPLDTMWRKPRRCNSRKEGNSYHDLASWYEGLEKSWTLFDHAMRRKHLPDSCEGIVDTQPWKNIRNSFANHLMGRTWGEHALCSWGGRISLTLWSPSRGIARRRNQRLSWTSSLSNMGTHWKYLDYK